MGLGNFAAPMHIRAGMFGNVGQGDQGSTRFFC